MFAAANVGIFSAPALAGTLGARAVAHDAAVVAQVPELAGMRDLGRAPMQTVSIAMTLAYRHDSELERLTELQGDESSPYYHHFLSNAQFADYFAPSIEDERRVTLSLERAGFRITGRFTNRTVVDAVAPAAVAERYFATEIHRVVQTDYGVRYVNVRPAIVPAELRGTVIAVTGLANAVYARTALQIANAQEKLQANERALAAGYGSGSLTGTRVKNFRAPLAHGREIAPLATTSNELRDPSFESGKFGEGWQVCAEYSASDPEVTTAKAHTGKESAYAGSVKTTSEIDGTAGTCQSVTIPTSGILTFYVYEYSNDTTKNAIQEADLLSDNGTRLVNFYATATSTTGWTKLSYNVSKYAGQRYFLYFGVDGNGATGHETYQYVDDVSLTGSAYPATGPKIGGAFFGPDDGYGPSVVADAYDFPVQHGYAGAGRSTGIEISGDYQGPDLATYLETFGITRGGTTTRVEVDGGAKFSSGSGSEEATLDVETVVSLAPSTELVMYLFPELIPKDIEDGYNAAVSANSVDVVNSSFGGCETGQTAYSTAIEKIVAQGASKGITFSASSGDSGSAECAGKLGVETPASIPNVVAVGGTSLYVNNNETYKDEIGWKDSGGGVSTIWAKPSYQTGLSGVVGTGRNVPDIAFPGDPSTGTSLFFNGAWAGPIGGTSWASPCFTALQTEVDQKHNSRFGYVNPTIYAIAKKYGSSAFHDVLTGSNGAYKAHIGYDDVTGIGSIKGYYFAGVE